MQTIQRRQFLTSSRDRRYARAAYWIHVSRSAMACTFEITIPSNEKVGVEFARAALDEIDLLEDQLTVFRETSEISLINREAARSAVRVEPQLFKLLRLAYELYRDTEQAFDITSGPLTRCWGFLKREGRVPLLDEIERARSFVGSKNLILDDRTQSIGFSQAGVEINLGSIGKGYALDRVRETLRKPVRAALLSAGYSSMCAIGSGHPRGWFVGVRHPRDKGKRLAHVWLRDCSLSTSGSEEQFFEYEGKRYGHIIDPRSGFPSTAVSGVTVIAQSSAVTDALATAFYVGGRELAERYCESHPNVLVIMLEANEQKPVIVGSNRYCEVELINE